MMKHVVRLLILTAVILLGWWAWTVFFPSPQAAIRHRLTRLAKLASFPANEGGIARLMNVEKMGGYFSSDVTVRLDAPGYGQVILNDREQLKLAALAARGSAGGIHVEFPDISIEASPGSQEAIADLTVNGDVGGEKSAILQELKLNLKKVDGDWVITHVETVKTLK